MVKQLNLVPFGADSIDYPLTGTKSCAIYIQKTCQEIFDRSEKYFYRLGGE